MKHSKRYRADAALSDPEQLYTPDEALAIIKQYTPGKFDETVEVSMRLGVDPRKADQMVRGTINLPMALARRRGSSSSPRAPRPPSPRSGCR